MRNRLFITIISVVLAANVQVRSASPLFEGKIETSSQHECVSVRVCQWMHVCKSVSLDGGDFGDQDRLVEQQALRSCGF